LKCRYEVFDAVKQYTSEVKAKWNLKLHKLRCDNGGEYIPKSLQVWCKSKGIVLDLLFDSCLGKEMWGKAIRTAAFIINRSPCEAVSTTPVEKWVGRKPDLSRLRIFGSKVYACITKPNLRKKLDSRNTQYIFVGYGSNCYRLWDESNRKIIISRDVKFVEDVCEVPNTDHRPDDNLHKVKISLDFHDEIENLNIDKDRPTQNTTVEVLEHNDETVNRPNENCSNNLPKRIRKLPERFNEYVMLTYEEAVSGPDKSNWLEAIEDEKQSLIENNTWTVVDKSEAENKKVLSNKWVFTKKDNGQYKARLVVRGFTQEEGIDYEETYSPVVNASSLRLIFALAAENNFDLVQFDIKTAFLYGKLEEEIFMTVPEGFDLKNKVLKLQKTLYGLKQAPYKWNEYFTSCLKKYGLIQTQSDRCVFTNGNIFLAIFVDDGILVGSDKHEMKKILFELAKDFKIKINENPTNFLGMEINRTSEGILLTQKKYLHNVLERYGMLECKPTDTPISPTNSSSDVGLHETDDHFNKSYPYRESVGSILYMSNKTRPDLSLAVGIESRHVENPSKHDIVNIKRTLRYLKGSQDKGILFSTSNEELSLNAYCDADYAND